MDYSFGTWVRHRRKALDLTQQELAGRLGCSASMIFKIESEERRPSRQIAELLVQHLEIPADQRGLFLKIARQQKGIDGLDSLTPLPEPKPVSVSQPNLPLPLTALIGREHELRAILQQLQDASCRLFTLTGPGGVGKTRLALEVAHQLRDSFHYGACFISLVGTSSSEFIIPAIADALGFVFAGALELKIQLFNYLKDKHILLVLDNLEHLLDGIELLDELLQRAPDLKLLTTSREQLNLRAEWVFDVQGLPVPSNIELVHLDSNSAAALFIQRAKQASAKFTPTTEDLDSINQICQIVEGLPLGLELAAAWVKMMSVKEIANEIERSINFLTTTARDLPARHRSIRAVFDHSWSLLSHKEQDVLMWMSVARGGLRREAAEQLAGATLPILAALVNKSLVRHDSAHMGRYDLHELIRQYAAARLHENASEEHAARDRHAVYYLDRLLMHEPALLSHRQKDAIAELGTDIDNLRVAWETAATFLKIDLFRKAMPPLWRFYDVRNYCQEGIVIFSRAAAMIRNMLAELQDVDSPEERASLEGTLGETLAYQAYFTRRLGRNAQAITLYQSSLELVRPLNDPAALAHVMADCGALYCAIGEFEQAQRYLGECLAVFRKLANEWQELRCLALLGWAAHDQGNYAEAYRLLSEAIQRFWGLGDPRHIAITANFYSRTLQALGRMEEAQEIVRASLRLATETGDQFSIGMALERLAVMAQAGGDETEARRLFEESVECSRRIGDVWSLSRVLNLQGYLALALDDDIQARESFREACQVALPSNLNPSVLDALTGLAMLDARNDHRERALGHVTLILQHPASTQETKNRAEQLRVELEALLTPEQISAARARVQSMTLDLLARDSPG